MRDHALARFARNRAALLGAGILIVVTAAAIAAPWLAPYDPLAVDLGRNFAGPSAAHVLGTDQLGRDTLSRLLYGARVSLLLSLLSVGGALVAGGVAGLMAAWYRGWVDAVVVRVVDVLLSFPDLLLAIAVIAVMGPGTTSTVVAVAAYALPTCARVARAAALDASSHDFIMAARAAGASTSWILRRHVWPLCVSPIAAQGTVLLGKAVIVASGLSFLGLGVQPPEAEWGAMLSRGRDLTRTAPLGAFAPGVAITLVALSFALVGDGLRDAMDPKTPR
jgi:ABC-type dipeptide/oligopeptide/nickel transport system permease subunit